MAGKEAAYHKIQKELVDLQTKMMEKESSEVKLREELEIKNAECEKSSETTKSLKKFEELLAKVKSDCRKVKKEKKRCREKLERKRRDISSLKGVLKEKGSNPVSLQLRHTLPANSGRALASWQLQAHSIYLQYLQYALLT